MTLNLPQRPRTAAEAARLTLRIVGYIIKPGGWNYLMPEPPADNDTTAVTNKS